MDSKQGQVRAYQNDHGKKKHQTTLQKAALVCDALSAIRGWISINTMHY